MTTSVWDAGAWVELGGGGSLTDQYPGPLLADRVDTATSVRTLTTVVANATPFADGAYSEIDASLSADAAGIFVHVPNSIAAGDTNSSTLLEIGTGAGGAEAHWASLQVGYSTANERYFVPGFIAAGTRVAARGRSAIASQSLTNFSYQFLPATKSVDVSAPVTMGHSTATAHGVVVTAPGSLNTKGAWTEIEDSTPSTFGVLAVCPAGAEDTTLSANGILLDIGIGAGGAETVLIPDIYLAPSTAETIVARTPVVYGVSVPSGSRLSARYARANAGVSLDVFLIGA